MPRYLVQHTDHMPEVIEADTGAEAGTAYVAKCGFADVKSMTESTGEAVLVRRIVNRDVTPSYSKSESEQAYDNLPAEGRALVDKYNNEQTGGGAFLLMIIAGLAFLFTPHPFLSGVFAGVCFTCIYPAAAGKSKHENNKRALLKYLKDNGIKYPGFD